MSKPTYALEIARYKVNPNDDAATDEGAQQFFAVARDKLPGFVSAIRAQLGDGEWVDLVLWNSRAEAEEAAARFPQIPELRELASNFTEIVEMTHGRVAYQTP